MPGLGLGLNLGGAANALADVGQAAVQAPGVYAQQQGLQLNNQMSQQKIDLAQRQAQEMEGLKRAYAEGGGDQTKTLQLIGQYAPSHLPQQMGAYGGLQMKQAQANMYNEHAGLYGSNAASVDEKTKGTQITNAKSLDELVSRVAQGAQAFQKPDGSIDEAAGRAYINQHAKTFKDMGLDPAELQGIPLTKENLDAYAKAGLAGHDFVQTYKNAHDAVGKVGQDLQNNFMSPETAAQRIKFLDTVKAVSVPGINPASLPPGAIETLAERYHIYGPPAFQGFGNRAISELMPAVIRKEVEMYGTATRDWDRNQAELKGQMGSIASMKKTYEAVKAFENTALANGQKAMEILGKVADTGSPMFNKPIRSFSKDVLGGKDVNTLEAALDVFSKEVARVTTNPNLQGQLTDNQIKEIKSLASRDITPAQFKDLYELYKFDMGQRHKNLEESLKGQSAEIRKINPMASQEATHKAGDVLGDAPEGREGKTGMLGNTKFKVVNGKMVAQ